MNKLKKVIPYIALLSILLYIYIGNNQDLNANSYSVFFNEIIILYIIFIIILFFINKLLDKYIDNTDFICLLLIIFQCLSFDRLYLIIFLLIIIVYFTLKKNKNIINFVNIFTNMLSFLFIFILLFDIYGVIYIAYNYNSRLDNKKNKYNINVDDSKKKMPNIYYIHCDGMTNTDLVDKYFKSNNIDDFKKYLKNEFIYNPSANFKGGFHTITATTALFNPYFYDEYFKDYIYDIEESYLSNSLSNKVLSYKQLKMLQFDNELFSALKKKNYETISITEFNQYTSFKTDKLYDIYDKNDYVYYYNKDFSQLSSERLYNILLKYHLMSVMYDYNNIGHISLNSVIKPDKKINLDINLNEYEYLNKTEFIEAKKIVKSIELENNDDKSKFYFIDYTIDHLTWDYDKFGNKISEESQNIDNFGNTYEYSTYLLMDIVKYIRNTDNDSIIVLQGDHGVHSLHPDILKKKFNLKTDDDILYFRNSTINAIYIPDEYKNGEEKYLSNPLNISRYIVNNYVGDNYEYIK